MAKCSIGLVGGGDARRISALEDEAVDSLWVGGHVASRNPSPEAMMGLARLAALTERVKIGTSILLLPLYPPALVAKQIADLDRATNGRVILGIGVGGRVPAGVPRVRGPDQERGRRTDEMIPLIRRLWTAEEITHEGRYYSMEDVRIHPAPVQAGGPPIVVAGRKSRRCGEPRRWVTGGSPICTRRVAMQRRWRPSCKRQPLPAATCRRSSGTCSCSST